MKIVDVLVIGAGPSGTIAAALIRKAGYSVLIVEKMQFPRFVIGESLLPRCMEALEEADLLNAVTAQGFQQKFGAKFVRDETIFDINFSHCHTKDSKTWTWQVPRADFDKTLADECERKGIEVLYKTEVTAITINPDESSVTTIKYEDGGTETVAARFIVDGSGYGRVIPKLFGLEKDSNLPPRQTLFTHFVDLKRSTVAREPNRITIFVFNETTWVWCIPFSNGNTSLGFVGFPEFFAGLEGTAEEKMRSLVARHPKLKDRFQNAEMKFEPKTLQSWSATTDKFFGHGYVLTGNVTEFLDPMFSSGVTLASVSAQKASALVLKKLKGEAVDWQTEYMDPCMKGVNVFKTFVMGWYNGDLHTIFFAEQKKDEMVKQISSVLAGYVWDDTNPFVSQHEKYVTSLANFLRSRDSGKAAAINNVRI
ncbi:MAG: tryptophan 7-halogenase [Bdellovibrionaceae bacterium]|nr:tryptophan 7-halogenase [Bdellovibrio sp.]